MLGTKASRPARSQIASLTSVPPVDARPRTRRPTVTITAATSSPATRRQLGAASTAASSDERCDAVGEALDQAQQLDQCRSPPSPAKTPIPITKVQKRTE